MPSVIWKRAVSFEIRVVRSARRRRIAFRIASDGAVEICAPPLVPPAVLLKAFEANRDRIENWRRRVLNSGRGSCGQFADGTKLWLFGEPRRLRVVPGCAGFDGEFKVPPGDEPAIQIAVAGIYRQLALDFLPGRVELLAEGLERRPRRISINSAKTRWGSCNLRGDLHFSWRIMQLPGHLIDYVIWHELTHLRWFNHSADFWAALGEKCQRSELLRRELRMFSRQLPRF